MKSGMFELLHAGFKNSTLLRPMTLLHDRTHFYVVLFLNRSSNILRNYYKKRDTKNINLFFQPSTEYYVLRNERVPTIR